MEVNCVCGMLGSLKLRKKALELFEVSLYSWIDLSFYDTIIRRMVAMRGSLSYRADVRRDEGGD